MIIYLIKKNLVELLIAFILVKTYRKKARAFLYGKFDLLHKKYQYAANYLNRYIKQVDNVSYDNVDYHKLPIWQLWLQGEEHAPELVKNCFASINKFSDGRKIIRLTRDTISQYIDLPDVIFAKYSKGKISHAHFSDIVRVCLLAKHGGTWVDATVLFTDRIPDTIVNSPFFAFRISPIEEYSDCRRDFYLANNWFMHAKPNHVFMLNMQEAMLNYWQHNNKAIHYYMYQELFGSFVMQNSSMKREWLTYPNINERVGHRLHDSLTQPFDSQGLADFKNASTIHKMNHHLKNDQAGTFLDTFIHQKQLFF